MILGSIPSIIPKSTSQKGPINPEDNLKNFRAYEAFNEGQKYVILGDYYKAISYYDLAIKYDPLTAKYYSYRGSAKLDMNDFDGSIADYSEAIKLSPYPAEYYYNRGGTYFKLNDLHKAYNDWLKASSLGFGLAKAQLERNFQDSSAGIKKKESNFFTNRSSDTSKVLHFGYYHPYRHGNNAEFDDFSRKILGLKDKNVLAVDYFFNKLNDYLGDNFTIVIVPSHNPINTDSGIRRLAKKLVRNKASISDGTNCLIRTELIEKLSSGGNRSILVHLRSMKVQNIDVIENRHVLLLDDVTTSNNSLKAGRDLLVNAGAKSVQAFALAQTD